LRSRRGTLAVTFGQEGELAAVHAECAALAEAHVPVAMRKAASERDGIDRLHLTVVDPAELKGCKDKYEGGVQVWETDLAVLGLGSYGKSMFAVVHSVTLSALRMRLGLRPKHFHVTLGFHGQDEHGDGARKGASSLVEMSPQAAERLTGQFDAVRAQPRAQQQELLRELYVTASDLAGKVEQCHQAAVLSVALKSVFLLRNKPEAVHDITEQLKMVDPLEAAFLTLRARFAGQELGEDMHAAREAHATLADLVPPPPADDRRVRWLVQVAAPAAREEKRVWGASEDGILSQLKPPMNCAPVPAYGDQLWGSGCPSEETARAIKALGVQRVVTLTEDALPDSTAQAFGDSVDLWHFPIDDRHAPRTVEALVQTCRCVQRGLASGDGVLVHCLGGKGRTALILASMLVLERGFSPSEALAEVKRDRATFVTDEQVRMLKKLYALVTRPPAALQGSGKTGSVLPRQLPRTIVLCGLPGAGKSTFALRLLGRLAPGALAHINQDELGRTETENGWASATASANRGDDIVAVLDKCNATKASRAQALDLCGGKGPAPVLVHFCASAEVCASRAAERTGHVGEVSGKRAERVVAAVAEQFEAPDGAREGYSKVYTVTDDAEAEALLSAWGCADNGTDAGEMVVKFPRTRHLVNLGAATRDDLLVPDAERWLCPQAIDANTQVVVEEKIDGANLGFSLGPDGSIRAQNRSHFVNSEYHEQFRKLGTFIETEGAEIRERALRDRHLVLYGEWVYAKHSVPYDRLPAYFVAFDLRCLLTNTFCSRAELERVLAGTNIALTPLLMRRAQGSAKVQRDVMPLVHRPSTFAEDTPSEGVYVRLERDGLTVDRAKIVRHDFIAGGEDAARWNHSALQTNLVAL